MKETYETQDLPPVAADVLRRAIGHLESSIHHEELGFYITGSNAATVARELFDSVTRIATEPASIVYEVGRLRRLEDESASKWLWHDANCYATAATELRLTARAFGLWITEDQPSLST